MHLQSDSALQCSDGFAEVSGGDTPQSGQGSIRQLDALRCRDNAGSVSEPSSIVYCIKALCSESVGCPYVIESQAEWGGARDMVCICIG